MGEGWEVEEMGGGGMGGEEFYSANLLKAAVSGNR